MVVETHLQYLAQNAEKNLAFDELFDVRAVRIVAERLQDCYAALGIVHTHYRHLPDEFDDYVAGETKRLSVYSYRGSGAGEKTVEIKSAPNRCMKMQSWVLLRTGNIKEGAAAGGTFGT